MTKRIISLVATKVTEPPASSSLPSFLTTRTSNGIKITPIGGSGADFNLITLDHGDINSPKSVPTDIQGLSDGTLNTKGPTFRSFDKVAETLTDRQSTMGSREVIFARETLKTDFIGRPMSIPIDEKKHVSREFLLVTYPGVGRYLESVWKNHVDGQPKKDYHRLACFHEALNGDQQPYKIYLDLEYESEKVVPPSTTDGGVSMAYELENVNAVFQKAIHQMVSRLTAYWRVLFPGSDSLVRHLVFDSSRGTSTHVDSLGVVRPKWKISAHLIWFVEGTRFGNQETVLAFVKAAFIHTRPENGGIKQSLEDFEINGQQILDFAPFLNKFFRAPYNTKISCTRDGILCPPLYPLAEFMDEKTLEIYRRTNPTDGVRTFSMDLFLLGLVNYVGDTEFEPKVTKIIICAKSTNNPTRMAMKQFEDDMKGSFENEGILDIIRDTFATSPMARKIMTLEDTKISIRERVDEISKDLGDVFSVYCMAITRNFYGLCKTYLVPISYQKVGDYQLIFFRCHTRGTGSTTLSNPCLARIHDRYRPHTSNINYLILNIHSLKWHMCCHNFGCIRAFLYRNGVDCNHMTDDQLKAKGIKARSNPFPITEATPNLLILVTGLSRMLMAYQKAKDELDTREKRAKPTLTEQPTKHVPLEEQVIENPTIATLNEQLVVERSAFC